MVTCNIYNREFKTQQGLNSHMGWHNNPDRVNGFEKYNNDIKNGIRKENNTHLYFPDFYLKDYNLYIEVKGYQRDRDLFKWKSIDNLLIIRKDDIKLIKENKFILNKTKNKFGN